jgi:predicted  nucleic acid-binding Zn-ribbon protein
LPMVDRSLLETRLMAILNDNVRPATARLGYLPVIGVMLLTLSLAAAQPAFVTSAMPNIGPAHTAIEGAAAVPANVPAIAQAEIDRNSACWWDTLDGRSFHGNISSSNSGGRTVIYEQVGTRGGDRIIQKSFGDLRLCMLAEGAADRSMTDRPSQWLSSAGRVVLEARRGNQVQRLEVTRQGQQRTWQVNGRDRAFDQAAQAWRDRMLTVLDTTWELSSLRGEVSSLRGQISSIRGEESSLRGHISSLGGQVSSLRGQISSIRGEESSLRGEISAIRGHLSSLDGEISSQRGAISSLYGSRSGASQIERDALAARIAQYEAEIKRIEQAIREYDAAAKVAAVEREIQARDVDAKTAAIEAAIRAFNVEGKVAEVERRIAALDVDGKVAAIERQISSLDAERRVRQLEDRREAELRQLEAAITALK